MEKYGPERGWKLGLRNPYEDKSLKNPHLLPNTEITGLKEGNVVEDKIDLVRGGISAMMSEDRNARVDVVRRTMITPAPALQKQ